MEGNTYMRKTKELKDHLVNQHHIDRATSVNRAEALRTWKTPQESFNLLASSMLRVLDANKLTYQHTYTSIPFKYRRVHNVVQSLQLLIALQRRSGLTIMTTLRLRFVVESSDLLTALTMCETKTREIPLVVTYHHLQLPCLGKNLPNHLSTLHILGKMKKAVPNPPLAANWWPKNLNLLVRVMTKPPQQLHRGSNWCGRPRCKSSMHSTTGITFGNTVPDETFCACVTANCKKAQRYLQ